MKNSYISQRERFYQERDLRTADYLGENTPALVPVSIHVSSDACETQSGQLLILTLVNQLARIHRKLRIAMPALNASLLIPAVCGGSSMGDEIHKLTKRIDPYGEFEINCTDLAPSEISIGIGTHCRSDLTWYLGYKRSKAELKKDICGLGHEGSADLRGAGLAALLGAAAATKSALNIKTVETSLSAWNFENGDNAEPGPSDLPSIDVGSGLIVGAGAVASAVVYWLIQWGNASSWTIIDGDTIELHNTNRSLLFFPDDAGWPDKNPNPKVACLSEYLAGIAPVHAWHDKAVEMKQSFDTVLVLANERDVRTSVSHRNDPIQLQATTGQSWVSQLHRHIAGRDDCVRCRMSDIRTPQLACGEAVTATTAEPNRPDASLPFLSAASGLMLVSALQRLQLGEFGTSKINRWNWDFRTTLNKDPSSYYECRDDCSTFSSAELRRAVAQNTRWADALWLAENRQSNASSKTAQ